MGVGAGLSMYVVVVQKFTFAISSPDEFLLKRVNICQSYRQEVTNRPRIICTSILLQYFSSASQQMHTVILWEFKYGHSVYLLVSELNNAK